MKVLILIAISSAARAAVVTHHVAGAPEAGTSNTYHNQDVAGNYNFGYDESHSSGGSFRRESGNSLGVKTGSYGLHNADGRVRVVNYVADGAGFRASIATNEPGTELGNYNFGYDERHTSGGSWRKESGDANGNTVGSYGLTDADGRVRVVHYVADSHGFRASVATNEPGTAPSSPSGVGINAPMGPTGPHGDVTLDGVSLSVAPIDVAATPAVSLADASPVAVPAPVAYAAAAAAPITRVAVAAPQVTYRAPEVTYAASQVNYATAPVARVAVAAPQVTYNAPQIVYAAAAAPRITFAAAPVTRVAYASAPYGRVTYGGPFRVSSVSHQIAAAAAPVSYTDVAPAAVKFANLGPAEVATHAAATRVATYAVPAPVFRRVVPIEFVGAGQAYLGGHGKYGR
ncbi:hypothetical protein HPB47_004123 [Ixodes persulcatus]|uniref:Uncharacterized protein n=1 Tax=Ixodes persulcatus TaxID=34615 RepID=A0AC60PGK1_IXOPE|nr:hypothetical protein HPB47_004123 [Ixodes persulcatus]